MRRLRVWFWPSLILLSVLLTLLVTLLERMAHRG